MTDLPNGVEILTKRRLLQLSEISLWIDHYDDIFSDFDSRPYSERALSEDFLTEVKRASRDKPSGTFDIKFLMPTHQRSVSHEHLIRKRLKDHFRKHYQEHLAGYRQVLRRGIYMTTAGVLMLLFASYLLIYTELSSFFHLIVALLEPGGWFLGWTGLDELIHTLRTLKPGVEFNEKMIHADVSFLSY